MMELGKMQTLEVIKEKDFGVYLAEPGWTPNSPEKGVLLPKKMIPEGTKTLAINPLNWQTGSTPADKTLNKGACFTDYGGNIVTEIPGLPGAYIDSARGALKVTDVTAEEFPRGLSIFDSGVYHLYDYQFFYRNLQENVSVRIAEYIRRQNG